METSAPIADNNFCKDMTWSSWDALPREASYLFKNKVGGCLLENFVARQIYGLSLVSKHELPH